jgi:hypothetical protein
MTQTIRKRPIPSCRSQNHVPPEGRDQRIEFGNSPADLADSLRTLALRAYRAVKAGGELNSRGPGSAFLATRRQSQAELVALRAEIIKLQTQLQNQRLGRLVPYVVALRRKVESKIGASILTPDSD